MRRFSTLLLAGAMTAAMIVPALATDITTTLSGVDVSRGFASVDVNAIAGDKASLVSGVTFTFTADDSDGFGGGFMMNSNSLGWLQRDGVWDWGNAEKTCIAEKQEDGSFVLTFDFEEYRFAPDEEYAQIVLQQWWGSSICITEVELLGIPEDPGEEEPGEEEPVAPKTFSDVKPTAWYAKAVEYIATRGIMNGNADGTFAPTANITRGQTAVMIWNFAGQPKVTFEGLLKDVKDAKKYYAKAVEWAYKNKVVNGNADGEYKPGASITRQDFAVILRNYAKSQGLDVTVTDKEAYKVCSDASKVSSYAVSTIQWAYNLKLMGKGGKLAPQDPITRAEAASMMQSFLKAYDL